MDTRRVTSVLVVGASGATGRLLVGQLLDRGAIVRAIMRSPGRLAESLRTRDGLELIVGSPLDLGEGDLVRHVAGCGAVASCLGHHLTLRGLFGPPHRLVSDATRRLCEAIRASGPAAPVRFVLMNTTGNRNRDLAEPVSTAERLVTGLLRVLLPPHADNENAADYLRTRLGREDRAIEWAAVRPDNLVDEDRVSEYDVHRSPARSAAFDPGVTSRINVAHFMAELATDDETWRRWRGQMPVIYNRVASRSRG